MEHYVFDVVFAAPWGALSQLEDPPTSTTTATTSTSSLSLHLLTDLVLIADGTYCSARSCTAVDTSYSNSSDSSSSFLLSGAATVGLLDKLLSAAAQRSDACDALQRRISAALTDAHCAGTASGYRFCVYYAAAVEARNSSSSDVISTANVAAIQQLVPRLQYLDSSAEQASKHSVMQGLQAVAESRTLLTAAAAAVCTALELTTASTATDAAATAAATEQAQALLTAVAALLTLPTNTATGTSNREQHKTAARVRAARLYFLRHLERGRGLTFVRGALRAPLLARHHWLNNWGDSSLVRFLGDSRLPRACFARALPGYAQTVQTVAAVARGDAASGDAPVPPASGLVCALFAEVALLRALDAGSRSADFDSGVQRVQEWLMTSGTAAAATASSPVADQRLMSAMLRTSTVRSVLTLTPASPSEAVLRAQVTAHLVGAALSAGAAGGPLQLFTELLLRPEALAGCFLPGMPADSGMEMVRTALAGSVTYYTCPNGHRYGIGNCGQPMQVSTCPECRAQIGGSNHVPLAGNTPAAARAEDSVQSGYCYSLSSTAGDAPAPAEGARSLRLPQLLAVRCLLHCALSVAAAAAVGGTASSSWCAELERALRPPAASAAGSASTSSGNSNAALTAKRIAAVCAERAARDWLALQNALRLSSDDVAAALHTAIIAACNNTTTTTTTAAAAAAAAAAATVPAAAATVPAAAAAATAAATAAAAAAAAAGAAAAQPLAQQLSTDAGRGTWEQRFVQQCLHNSVIVDNTAAARQELAATTSDDDQDALAADILRDDDISSSYSTTGINSSTNSSTNSSSSSDSSSGDSYTGLWAHRTPFTFAAFLQAFEARSNTSSKKNSSYPLLTAVLQRQSSLPALRALSQALQWVTRLSAHYAHKLSRSAAQKLTVREALAQLDSTTDSTSNSSGDSGSGDSSSAAAAAFAGFAAAWNTVWKDVQRFGCLAVPTQYADVVMTYDTLLCFCLPGDRDEGICCLALLQVLLIHVYFKMFVLHT
jgi:trimeric autotransporter adhesin